MNAEEARKITMTSVDGIVHKQTEGIKKAILEAAQLGKTEILIYYAPHYLVKQSLTTESYKLYTSSSINETVFRISWK